ncbi:MAG TPA: hypothetical protein VFE25_15300, partial [Opitutaceae bacterium]|nr:hypothetical protein [Opitutaceae bacterium]
MNKKIFILIALACGLGGTSARAQNSTPLLVATVNEVDVTNNTVGFVEMTTGGSGYGGNAPTVVFKGGGGSGASGTANLDGSGNAVISVTIDTPGMDYVTPPALSFVGGGPGTGATTPTQASGLVGLTITKPWIAPNQNEGFGPAGDTIIIYAVAVGTDPASGFIFNYTVNGLAIGHSSDAVADGQPVGVYWTPALPGVYSLVASTTDGNGNNATSVPIRYFAAGTVIVSPTAGGANLTGVGTLVPVGSAVIVQATSTADDGFVKQISFYTDWNGTSGTLIGTSTNYPFSVSYSPAGAAGATHLIKAVATDNLGATIPAPVSGTNPNQDEIKLTMTTANPGGLPSG